MASEGPEIIVVYVTTPSGEAHNLARALLERRLVACVNIVAGIRSLYRWEGAVQDDEEALMIMKTGRARFENLRAAVVELHPYDVPEVIALPVMEAHEPYQRWVLSMTSPEEPTS